MTPIRFFAEGIPKGQPRPRAFAINGKARVYDAGTAEGWKACVALAAKPFLAERISEPVRMSCMFVFPRPKFHFYTGKRSHVLRETSPLYNFGKPDIDNALKAVMDALVVLGLFADDALIVQIESAKLYAIGNRTGALITIEPADTLFATTLADTISETLSGPRRSDVEDSAGPAQIAGVPPAREPENISVPQ